MQLIPGRASECQLCGQSEWTAAKRFRVVCRAYHVQLSRYVLGRRGWAGCLLSHTTRADRTDVERATRPHRRLSDSRLADCERAD